MRLPLMMVAALVALLSTACNGPEQPTPALPPENTVVETHEVPEPSPTAAPPTAQAPENTLIETPEYAGIIVSKDGASEFAYLFDQPSITSWEPSVDDVTRAEERIRQCLVSVRDDPQLDAYGKENLAFILDNLDQYRRQYVGIDVDGEKHIWINAFISDNLRVDWKRMPVDVEDGGNRYWQIEYDLLTDECVNFYVHGEA